MTGHHDDGGDERPSLARELIATGRGERASHLARLLAKDALLTAGASTGVAPVATWGTTLKWLGVSVLVLGSAGLASYSTSDEAARPVVAVASAPPAPPVVPVLPVRAAAAALTSPLPPAQSPFRPRAARPLPAPGAAAVETAAAASVPGRDLRLRQELDALRAARQALDAGAPVRALAALHAKSDGFSLLPVEADIVRVEAMRSAGDQNGARQLARELLREHGRGPYAERLKTLVPE
jgi:hypothetical protein